MGGRIQLEISLVKTSSPGSRVVWPGLRLPWQVLGQQVLMQKMVIPAELLLNASDPDVLAKYSAPLAKLATGQPLTPDESALFDEASKIPYNLDAWDGYGVERETILQTAAGLGKKLVSLAGDTYNAWSGVLDVMSSGAAEPGQVVGVEFATPGVSSPGIESAFGPGLEPLFTSYTDGFSYADLSRRGFLDITFHSDHVTSNYQLDAVEGWTADVLQSDDPSVHANCPGLMPRQLRISQPNLPVEGSENSSGLVPAMTASRLETAKAKYPLEAVTMASDGGRRAQLLLGDDVIHGRGGPDELRGGPGRQLEWWSW